MPSDTASGLPKLGHTWFEGTTAPTTYAGTVQLEGQTQEFRDLPANTAGQAEGVRSGMTVKARFVRNVANIALLPKRVVKFASGYYGRRVDGYCRLDHEEVAGVVDPYLPTSGVPDDDLFWMICGGPCLIKMPLSNVADVAQGAIMTALTAATSQATTAGRVQPLAGTSNQTNIGSGVANMIGRAMSAVSSTSTLGEVLVDVTILK